MVAAVVAIVVGRVLGLIELYVLAAGALVAVSWAIATVWLRSVSLEVRRWIHPPVLTVGDRGRVDLTVTATGPFRSPRVLLVESVGRDGAVHLGLGPVRSGREVSTAYLLPAERRGVLPVGPLVAQRRDLLGLAARSTELAPCVDVVVAPRVLDLAMPQLGQGTLGRHLLAQSRRLGLGEFHGLRDYVDGDEPRTIHWRASARSEGLKVKEHTAEGVRRCIVVLDRDVADEDAFERAVVAAASLVTASDQAGLTTRFVTAADGPHGRGGVVDLRGPDVVATTLRVVSTVQPGAILQAVDRDPGEGLGLVVVVTESPDSPGWTASEQLLDPGLTRIGVFTTARAPGRFGVDATSESSLRTGWDHLCGRGVLDLGPRVLSGTGGGAARGAASTASGAR